MHTEDVVNFFGDVQKVADFFGLTREAVYTWRRRPGGIIPRGRAVEVAAFSNGKLRFNPDLYAKDTPGKQGKLNHENQTRAHP